MKQAFYWLLLLPILFAGCSKDDDTSSDDNPPTFQKEIVGYVQKGPFIMDTSVTVQELTNKLVPTGKTFATQIKNDNGSFKLSGEFSQEYAEIIASGFYYNEITGKLSDSPITLRTLSKIDNKANININVLTTLRTPRVKKLMSGGATFEAAVTQSQKEVLKAFNIEKDNNDNSFDQCNIAQKGEDNAILLAISSIMQYGKNEAELSEFIAKVSSDIENDGTLDSQSLKTNITNSASSIDNNQVQENLRQRFEALGMTDVSIPDFYGYLDSDGDGVLNYKKPYVNCPTDYIYLRKGELTYTLKWAANCTPKVVLPEGCDWIQIKECTNEKLVITFTKADQNREAIFAVKSSDDVLQKEVRVEQQGEEMLFQITMNTGASPRAGTYDFFDGIVSDISVVAFDKDGKMLFMKNEENPQISANTYKCYVKLDNKLNENCTIYTIINSPYDFSGFEGTLSDFTNLQSNVDLTKATNLENFYIGETNEWTIDNSLDQDPTLEKPAPTVTMKHPIVKVECAVSFEHGNVPFEKVRSITVKGGIHYNQGSFFTETNEKSPNMTLNTLVNNQCGFYLYAGSFVESFDIVLDESNRPYNDALMPKIELEANKKYRFILNVYKDEITVSVMTSSLGGDSNIQL